MRPVRASVVLFGVILWMTGCAAALDPDTAGAEPPPPTAVPPAASALRLASFGGWNGTATSEHFQLNRMELTPYNTSGFSALFSLLSTTTWAPIVAGEL